MWGSEAYMADIRQIEEMADEGQLTEEGEDNREKISESETNDGLSGDTRMRKANTPEQIEKAKHLDQHADGWPFEEDEEDAAEKAGGPAELVPPREKRECLLWADDEEEATEEEDLHCVTANNVRS
jgi:hypothetical protein